jgi:membrane protein YdbS with pleckstrin-like domain
MLGDVTSRPPTGQAGLQSGDPVQHRPAPAGSLPASEIGPPDALTTTAPPTAPGEPFAAPLAGDLPTERHRLPARVTRYWRWRAFCSALPLLVLLVSAAVLLPWGPWWARWGVVAVFIAVIAACLIILPPIRHRVFWYAISPTEIDIQEGIFFTKRSVVPMRRVQTLRSERGPIADHYRMTTLKIRTAAGAVSLSGLDRDEADALCDRICRLTDLADDV